MHLKRLEAYGFKSFADRLVLNFTDGVTCIVGPNGCGKSNISDAIRWVLGEQNAQDLRTGKGRKMDQVIFKGTTNRKPMAYCEVTLTFDNKDRTLLVDSDEVSVMRKMYRTGESEYYINNQRDKLKNLINLFRDTGIGKDGYSIIGQGKIDTFLTAKPEDRRQIFEEAAGITKYKANRKEATRSLEKTQVNLDLVTERLRSLESRMEPLKKQAIIAEKANNFKQRIKILDVNHFLYITEHSEEQKRALTEKLVKANSQLEHANNEQTRINSEYDAVIAEINNADVDIKVLYQRIVELTRATASKDSEQQKLIFQLNSAEELITEKQQEIEEKRKVVEANAVLRTNYMGENQTVTLALMKAKAEEEEFKKKVKDVEIFEVSAMNNEGMDNLLHPHECIKEAQELYALATNAQYAKFLVNGSTSGILVMLLSVLKAHDKIILPRNVHKSVINGLILSGAFPIFVMPEIDKETEIVNQISFEKWKETIDNNLDAKAIFIINPTYFGATADLKKIVEYAHEKNIIVLVDEAHGSHFYFNSTLPITAMDANADMATLSIHKTGGSLTQSSLLLIKSTLVDIEDVNNAFNLITTTSPSNILLASLDASRKFLVFKGEKEIKKAIDLCAKAKDLINKIDGFRVLDKEYFLSHGCSDYDTTKLVIRIEKLALNGFQVYKILQKQYHIQIELAETNVLLCLFTIGSKEEDIKVLVNALKEISKVYYKEGKRERKLQPFNFSKSVLRPRSAYQGKEVKVKLEESLGYISKEMIMIYPPGIPLIIPGEIITKEILKQLDIYRKKKVNIISKYTNCDFVSCVAEKDDEN